MVDFEIPKPFLEKLFELTGDGTKNRGYMLFYVDSRGNVRQIITRQDEATLDALRKKAETFLMQMDEKESFGSQNFEFENND